MPAKIISILNMKGGVGKTNIALNLAHTLADKHGKRVLVVDFDPQANASGGLLSFAAYEKHRDTKKVISDIFTELEQIVGPVTKKRPKLIGAADMTARARTYAAGYIDLIPSELELSTILERSGGSSLEDRLRLILKPVHQQYDQILIDCGPTYSVLTNNALKASDYVLVPVKPDPFSARGIPLLLSKIEAHNLAHEGDEKVAVLGIVFSMVNDYLQYVADVKAELYREHKNIFRTEIRHCEHYSRALFENKSIFDTNAQETFKANFADFVNEFLQRLEAPRE